MRIGLVFEGSHDYLFLKPICHKILLDLGYVDFEIEAIHPQIDATSMQVGGGGWPAVEQWCRRNSGVHWANHFDQPLFATSVIYDAIVVHIDGDVADVPDKFEPVPFVGSIEDRVSFLNNWILSLLQPPDDSAAKLIHATPVLHMEAWILAGLNVNAAGLETRSCKESGKRVLRRRFSGNARQQVTSAAEMIASSLPELAERCKSFKLFFSSFNDRFPAV